ncbi:MAG TPA: hypothetical protein VF353_07610, partial [Candidatus Binatia bacterium]
TLRAFEDDPDETEEAQIAFVSALTVSAFGLAATRKVMNRPYTPQRVTHETHVNWVAASTRKLPGLSCAPVSTAWRSRGRSCGVELSRPFRSNPSANTRGANRPCMANAL